MRTTLRRASVPCRIAVVLACLVPGVPALAAAGVPAAQSGQTAAQAVKAPQPQTLDAILRQLASFDGGIDSEAVWTLRDYVHARKDDAAARAACESALVQFLKGPATPAAKLIVSRNLRLIVSDASVPALSGMLSDSRVADLALYALQPIPGPAVDRALVQAMSAADGPVKIAVVAVLGERRTVAAVPGIAALLAHPLMAEAAATALGRIGGHDAAAALAGAYSGAAGRLRETMAAAMLSSADSMLAARDVSGARPLYETLASDTILSTSLRRAAVMGRIAAAGPEAASVLLAQLEHSDPPMQEAAIARIADVFAPDAIAPVCALLPRLPGSAQVKALTVLAGYPGERVRDSIMRAAESDQAEVRLAALKALEKAGDHAAVPLLLGIAARGPGAEQLAARAALGMLRGRAVDEAILRSLEGAPADAVRVEVLVAIGDRRIFPAKPAVAALLGSSSRQVRIQTLKTLRAIGTPSDVPAVLDVLVATADETEQREAEKTVADLARMTKAADGRSRFVRARLTEDTDPDTRARLIALLPLIGDPASLPALRAAAAGADPTVTDAAVRATLAWPTTDARDDIIGIARNSRNETYRLLAIAGLVRVTGLDRYRNPQAAVADLRLAAELSWRPEEQKLILGAVAQFPCREALDLAAGFLRVGETRAEAQAAIARITERLPKEAIRQ